MTCIITRSWCWIHSHHTVSTCILAFNFSERNVPSVTARADSLDLNNTCDRISSISSDWTPDAWPLGWRFSDSSGRNQSKTSTRLPGRPRKRRLGLPFRTHHNENHCRSLNRGEQREEINEKKLYKEALVTEISCGGSFTTLTNMAAGPNCHNYHMPAKTRACS